MSKNRWWHRDLHAAQSGQLPFLGLLIYRDKIDAALQALSQNPQLGHARTDLPSTHLAYLVGSHVIVYSVGTDSIGVVRILHQRMYLSRHV